MSEGRRLMNHVINSVDVMDKKFCGVLCFMEPNCFSYNLMAKSETGKHKCELNNATHEGHEEDLENNSSYIYRGAKVDIVYILHISYNAEFGDVLDKIYRQEDIPWQYRYIHQGQMMLYA